MKASVLIAFAFSLAGIPVAYAASPHALTGWGPFKFRMTAWQALHVPGAEPMQSGNIGYLTSIKGETVIVTVVPTSTHDGLSRIAIRYDRPAATTTTACVEAKNQIEGQVSAKYGTLSPSEAEGDDVLLLPGNTGVRIAQAGADAYGTPCFVVVTFFHEATVSLPQNAL